MYKNLYVQNDLGQQFNATKIWAIGKGMAG